jgi:hypothetical protein
MSTTIYVFHPWIEATETADTVVSVFGQWWDGDVVSGPTYTLTADAASFTLTGIAAGLQASRTLTADAASFTLTGIDANLLSVKTMAADVGTFALTGIDANLTASRLLGADAVAFVFTGIDAGLTASRTIAMAVGEFTLTGIDATLTFTTSDVPSIDTLLVTRTAAATLRFTGTTDGNRIQYYIEAAPGSTPDESDPPTGEVTVTRNTPFDFDVEGVDVGGLRVHARAAHRGNVGSWAAL